MSSTKWGKFSYGIDDLLLIPLPLIDKTGILKSAIVLHCKGSWISRVVALFLRLLRQLLALIIGPCPHRLLRL